MNILVRVVVFSASIALFAVGIADGALHDRTRGLVFFAVSAIYCVYCITVGHDARLRRLELSQQSPAEHITYPSSSHGND